MTTPDEDVHHMKSYLNLDERERANVQVEHDKYARRKAAMAYAAQEAIAFTPILCSGCDVQLTSQNHGHDRQCRWCYEESAYLKRAELAIQERQSKKLAEAKASGIIVMAYVLFLCSCAAFGAYGLSRAVNALAWWIGGALP